MRERFQNSLRARIGGAAAGRGLRVLTMSPANTSDPFITCRKELCPPFLGSGVGEISSSEDRSAWKSVGGAGRAAEPTGEGAATLGKCLRVCSVLRADAALRASQAGSWAAEVLLLGQPPPPPPLPPPGLTPVEFAPSHPGRPRLRRPGPGARGALRVCGRSEKGVSAGIPA